MAQYRFLSRGQAPDGRWVNAGEVVTIVDDFTPGPHMLLEEADPVPGDPDGADTFATDEAPNTGAAEHTPPSEEAPGT